MTGAPIHPPVTAATYAAEREGYATWHAAVHPRPGDDVVVALTIGDETEPSNIGRVCRLMQLSEHERLAMTLDLSAHGEHHAPGWHVRLATGSAP